ncbi:outer membrane protein [Aureimonas sp. AU22]|uniref:outer membrane protein n=1 Tax=Aureimonas sp. AU22 TaxID=1638162 RepID=UPI0007826D21|nr:outer membrane protein [Aureimonas sp. AU22]
MKKLLLALTASAIAGPAFAADIVDYPPEPPPVAVLAPAFSWTGLYVGGQAGGSFNGGSSNMPSSFVFVPGIAASPGREALPPTPFIPGSPGSPAIPGTPGSPGTPGTPGTPAVFGTLEYSCTGAAVGGIAAGSCAVEYPDGTDGILTAEELSAAYAAVGGVGALAAAGQFQTIVTPAQPGTPGTPAVPATPGTPAVPATPDTPATAGSPAVAPTPGRPAQTYAYDFGANHRSYSEDDDSFAGGGHVGYNFALGDALGGQAFVLGVVGDLSYVDITKSAGITNGVDTIGASRELDYLATVRLKGGVGLDRFLVYGTGGVAFGNVETTIVNTPFGLAASDDDTRVGYAVGAGTDYAVTDNLILGLEYLYTDLGSTDSELVIPLADGSTLTTKSDDDFDFHTVWAKASFRFN